MKVKCLLASLLMTACLHTATRAQDKAPSFIGISGGLSLPSGNLTSTDYADPRAGFARKTGLNLAVEGAYYLSPVFGIGGTVSTSTYRVNPQPLSDGFQEDFEVDEAKVTVTGGYRTLNVLVGPYVSVPAGKFTVDFRALGGVAFARMPEMEVVLENEPAFYQRRANATAFAFQVGTGLRYSLTEQVALSLRADYFYTKPDFSVENVNRNNNTGRLIEAYHQPFSGINTTLGIAYQFGR